MSMKGIAAVDQSVLDDAGLIALVRQTQDEFESTRRVEPVESTVARLCEGANGAASARKKWSSCG